MGLVFKIGLLAPCSPKAGFIGCVPGVPPSGAGTNASKGKGKMSMEMTPRENMMAILEGRQPEWYGDFQSAVEIMMDPIWKSYSVPRDGL